MQKVQLEARAAACTAAMRACRSGGAEKSWAVALGFLEKMLRWSIRAYDGTGAALGLCEAMVERWQGALTHLAGMRQKGVSRLIRSHAAVAEACESSLADWRLSAELLETTEQLSQDQGGPERFLQDIIPTKIMAYSRGAYWNVALQVHQSSSSPGSMSVQAYNALMWSCGLRAGSWDVVLRFLDEMYSEDLMPDSDTFASAMEACGAANEWEWILQLLARGFKMFQVFFHPFYKIGEDCRRWRLSPHHQGFFCGCLGNLEYLDSTTPGCMMSCSSRIFHPAHRVWPWRSTPVGSWEWNGSWWISWQIQKIHWKSVCLRMGSVYL